MCAMLYVSYDQLRQRMEQALLHAEVPSQRAALCAGVLADNTRDGVYSHGLRFFAGMIEHIRSGRFNKDVEPRRVQAAGAFEQWDGQGGIGIVNAWFTMGRAIELSRQYGIGCAALRHTNHWTRAGAYPLRAADEGCIGICWTNTNPLMPPWGSAQVRLGNNPLAIGVPRADGRHVLLDMAMSQYSMGRLATMARRGHTLAIPGGYDIHGNLTTDAKAIQQSRRPIPIGYWKGSGFALVLDMIAALLSSGQASHEIGRAPDKNGASQIFIALDLLRLVGRQHAEQMVEHILADYATAEPLDPAQPVSYPGQGMMRARTRSMSQGVEVEEADWQSLLTLASTDKANTLV